MMSQQACHNCRRQRLKCDRSMPQCSKCTKRGQECLGYQRLLLWQDGVASRGKLASQRYGAKQEPASCREPCAAISPSPTESSRQRVEPATVQAQVPLLRPLTDPLTQDLTGATKSFISYFANHVCPDFVVYDTQQNPFRDVIPLTSKHPVLLQIIIANSAIHMLNMSQPFLISGKPDEGQLLDSRRSESRKLYYDALTAKQQALNMLRQNLAQKTSMDVDVTLAVIILFINLELMDAGQADWIHHINGGRMLVEALCKDELLQNTMTSPLRRFLVSNWMVSSALGSISTSAGHVLPDDEFDETTEHTVESLIRDAEGNHCSSFPSILLQLLRSGVRLSQSGSSIPLRNRQDRVFMLVCTAKTFDARAWATDLQSRSPSSDVQQRTHVACAHKVAVIIYLSRLLLSMYPDSKPTCNFESLVTEIVDNLSLITERSLYTAITWPAFIAGAETNSIPYQRFIMARLENIWKLEPWGLLRKAAEILQTIWDAKTSGPAMGDEQIRDGDWVQYLRVKGVDWLIL